MRAVDELRERLTGAGLPSGIAEVALQAAGQLVTALAALAALDLADAEPFPPARRLPDDAVS